MKRWNSYDVMQPQHLRAALQNINKHHLVLVQDYTSPLGIALLNYTFGGDFDLGRFRDMVAAAGLPVSTQVSTAGQDGQYPFGLSCTVPWYGMVWYGMVWYGHGMAWHGMVWYGMVWYGMVWYGMVWYGMVWYGMVWYGMVRYGTVWYGMAWYGTVRYGMVWHGCLFLLPWPASGSYTHHYYNYHCQHQYQHQKQ